jgi:hypothetical protein
VRASFLGSHVCLLYIACPGVARHYPVR